MRCTLFRAGNYNTSSYLELLQSGENYFDILLSVIREAKKEIHLQSYSLEYDETGKMIINELKAAAQRGVKVYLLLDAYGSNLNTDAIVDCKKSDIFCNLFSPFIYLKFRTGRRLHHKILVSDGQTAIVGGINLADKYHGPEDSLPWLDFALLIRGDVCMDIRKRCIQLIRNKNISFPSSFGIEKEEKNYLIRITQNDWFRHKRNIYSHLKEVIRFSEKEIIIVCSYFIPTLRLVRLLTRASGRRVKICLYLQGQSDIPLARNATRFWYRAFFRNSINIF